MQRDKSDCRCFTPGTIIVVIVFVTLLWIFLGSFGPGEVHGRDIDPAVTGLVVDVKKFQTRRILQHINYKTWLDHRLDVKLGDTTGTKETFPVMLEDGVLVQVAL